MSASGCCYTARRTHFWRKEFQILNSSGTVCYFVKFKSFLTGKSVVVFNSEGQEVAYVQKSLSFVLPKYTIYINGDYCFTLKRKFSFMPKYVISDFYWSVEGTFGSYQYRATDQNGKILFYIARSDMVWKKEFITIEALDNHLYALCCALAIEKAEEDNFSRHD